MCFIYMFYEANKDYYHWQSCRLAGSYLFMKYSVLGENAEKI